MTEKTRFQKELFAGLNALAESSFPKKCANCGRSFETAEAFLLETQGVNESSSGLKQSVDDDGRQIVEAFRNCPCGSTLMDFFSDRRDLSEAGLKRREKFEKLLIFLVDNGLDRETARQELLKVVRGERSEILSSLHPPQGGGVKR